MNLSFTKKILLSVLGLGVVGSLVGMSTFASFNATATNANNSFATGTLIISQENTGDANYDCTTVPGTTDNATCGALFSVSGTGLLPGSDSSKTFKIKNAGSLPGTYTFQVGAVSGTTSGTLPDKLMISLYDQTKDKCILGPDTNADGNCDDDIAALASVDTDYILSALDNATYSLPGTAVAPWASSEEHTFVMTYALAPDEGNTLQGKDLQFTLSWLAAQ